MGNIEGTENTEATHFSPFGGHKTSQQLVQLSIDPSFGLTRKRYGWWSNGTRFDETLFSDVEAGIRLETTATGTDEARIRSAYPGQYISQAVATPGLGTVIDSENVTIDSEGRVSLTHGEKYAGAFYWNDTTDEPETGVGYVWDTEGWRFFIKSLGEHIGPSPIPQAQFGFDSGDDDGHRIIDPSNGYVWNWPYTWYNEGPLGGAYLDPYDENIMTLVKAVVEGRPSTDTPNLPLQLVVRNAGTAESLGVELGGMQYTTYGAGKEDLERRGTPETREEDSLISTTRVLSENAIDPDAEAGEPIVSARREDGFGDLTLRTTSAEVQPTEDIWLFAWDEWNPGTALTGATFTQPVSPNNSGRETHLVTDTQATDYTPTVAAFRGMQPIDGGQTKKIDIRATEIDLRVPLEATRVYTAVLAGNTNAADLDPFKITLEEGY